MGEIKYNVKNAKIKNLSKRLNEKKNESGSFQRLINMRTEKPNRVFQILIFYCIYVLLYCSRTRP